jgi:hypothetical protein
MRPEAKKTSEGANNDANEVVHGIKGERMKRPSIARLARTDSTMREETERMMLSWDDGRTAAARDARR